MARCTYTVAYPAQQPPLLLLSLAQLQGLDAKQLVFSPQQQQQHQQEQQQQHGGADEAVILTFDEEGQQQQTAVETAEFEAAKVVASSTHIGQTVCLLMATHAAGCLSVSLFVCPSLCPSPSVSFPSLEALQTEQRQTENLISCFLLDELLLDEEGESLLRALFSLLGGSSCFPRCIYSSTGISNSGLQTMNSFLSLRTFLVGHRLSLADLAVYVHLRVAAAADKTGALPDQWSASYPCVVRWFNFIRSVKEVRGPVEKALKQKALGPRPASAATAAAAPAAGKSAAAAAAAGGGKAKAADTQASYEGEAYTSQQQQQQQQQEQQPQEQQLQQHSSNSSKSSSHKSSSSKLQNAVMGAVVTRFPPEPSGYLHIGHAKAALLNGYFARKYQGKMIFRLAHTKAAAAAAATAGIVTAATAARAEAAAAKAEAAAAEARAATAAARAALPTATADEQQQQQQQQKSSSSSSSNGSGFDDTNPAKESAEFEESILEDTKKLGVSWDRVTYTSDYFERLQDACTDMIKKGVFYVDNTPTEQLRHERGEGIESASRSLPPEENLRRWQQMLQGTAEGQSCCVRAKIDMQHKNKCMRDPVMYRCVSDASHHRKGDTFKAYPTYDFACPLVDAWEGVTHALRTNEYADRIAQYHWVQEAVGVRRVEIYEFSRLCFVKTVLSKRKLKAFVDRGLVTGWDDPRMPTVRGILRRGLTVEALLDFILQQGPSKAGNLMEWDKLWTINKQVIDPVVPRYMAVSKADGVPVEIEGAPTSVTSQPRRLHAKNENLGSVDLFLFNKVLIETDDAQLCQEGEEVTLMHWGNCILEKLLRSSETGKIVSIKARLHLEGDFKTTKKKLHWVPLLPQEGNIKLASLVLRELDHLIKTDKIENDEDWEESINPHTLFDTEALGDPNLRALKEGDKLQLERRGYFRVDKVEADSMILLKIPDGRAKAMSTVSSKVDAAALSGSKLKNKRQTN
ncbi:hypothetical protein Efla_004605 [Eimeria flavescens]